MIARIACLGIIADIPLFAFGRGLSNKKSPWVHFFLAFCLVLWQIIQGVVSSRRCRYGSVVEHIIGNDEVEGSILSSGTMLFFEDQRESKLIGA